MSTDRRFPRWTVTSTLLVGLLVAATVHGFYNAFWRISGIVMTLIGWPLRRGHMLHKHESTTRFEYASNPLSPLSDPFNGALKRPTQKANS